MEAKLCDLCGAQSNEIEDSWKDWNIKNILEVRDLCKSCYDEFRKLIEDFKASKRKHS